MLRIQQGNVLPAQPLHIALLPLGEIFAENLPIGFGDAVRLGDGSRVSELRRENRPQVSLPKLSRDKQPVLLAFSSHLGHGALAVAPEREYVALADFRIHLGADSIV